MRTTVCSVVPREKKRTDCSWGGEGRIEGLYGVIVQARANRKVVMPAQENISGAFAVVKSAPLANT